jgi:hypothetical protein
MIEKFKCAIINKYVENCEECIYLQECLSMAEAKTELNHQQIEDDEE